MLRHRIVPLGLILGVAACTGQGGMSGGIERIPVTTTTTSARAAFERGQMMADVNRGQEANGQFRQATQQDPTFGYAYLMVANTANSWAQFTEYLDLAAQNADNMSDGEQLMLAISQTAVDNDNDRAYELAQELVGKYPRSPRAWMQLGFAQSSLKQEGDARTSYTRATEIDPEFYAGWSALGSSLIFLDPKDYAAGEEAMASGLALIPGEAWAHINMGDALRAGGDLAGAREHYTHATERDPTLGVAQSKRGHANSFLGNYEEARADYDGVSAEAIPFVRAFQLNFRAFIHLHEGNPQGAIDELRMLVGEIAGMGMDESSMNSALIFATGNMATIALHNDLLGQAAELIGKLAILIRADAARSGEAAIEARQNANVALWEGRLAAHLGDWETATALAEENRTLRESDADPRKLNGYHALMGLIDLRQGNYTTAAEHYRQSNLDNPYNEFRLAQALEGAGEMEAANKLYAEVAGNYFNNVTIAVLQTELAEKTTME